MISLLPALILCVLNVIVFMLEYESACIYVINMSVYCVYECVCLIQINNPLTVKALLPGKQRQKSSARRAAVRSADTVNKSKLFWV